MNTKKISILFILLLMLGVNFYWCNSTETLSDIQLANIEALSSGESEALNTGPREKAKCYGGGHKMVCRGINSNPCTDSDCF